LITIVAGVFVPGVATADTPSGCGDATALSAAFAQACQRAVEVLADSGRQTRVVASQDLLELLSDSQALFTAAHAVTQACLEVSVDTNCANASRAESLAVDYATTALSRGADCASDSSVSCVDQLASDLHTVQLGVVNAQSVDFPCIPIFNTCDRHENLSESGGGYQCCGGPCEMYLQYDDHIDVGFSDYLGAGWTDVHVHGQSETYIQCVPFVPPSPANTYDLVDTFAMDGAIASISANPSGGSGGIGVGSTSDTQTTHGLGVEGLIANYDVYGHGPIWGYGHTSKGMYTVNTPYVAGQSWSNEIKGSKAL
jgi:hypothetical protein